MNEPLLHEGLNLLLYGMGTVIIFLTVLVAVTVLMSALITRFSAADDSSASVSTSPVPSEVDERVLEIIQQAINQHRRR